MAAPSTTTLCPDLLIKPRFLSASTLHFYHSGLCLSPIISPVIKVNVRSSTSCVYIRTVKVFSSLKHRVVSIIMPVTLPSRDFTGYETSLTHMFRGHKGCYCLSWWGIWWKWDDPRGREKHFHHTHTHTGGHVVWWPGSTRSGVARQHVVWCGQVVRGLVWCGQVVRGLVWPICTLLTVQ